MIAVMRWSGVGLLIAGAAVYAVAMMIDRDDTLTPRPQR